MGSAVRAAVAAQPDLELVAAVDPAYAAPAPAASAAGAPAAAAAPAAHAAPAAGAPAAGAPPTAAVGAGAPPTAAVGAVAAPAAAPEPPGPPVVSAATPGELPASLGLDVAVDFTTASAVLANAQWCAESGVHLVCGTTGLGEAGLARLAQLFGGEHGPNCVVAANFAVSAVLMMRFAELAAPFFDSAEVIELHHDRKVDAPSGTAIETARRIAGARRASGGPFRPDPTETSLPGARGALVGAESAGGSGDAGAIADPADGESGTGVGVGAGGDAGAGVRVHAVRLQGLVAHQEVLFGAEGQSLTIRQDSYDRSSFMPGVLLAVRSVASRPGLTVGLEPLLGI
jgi:4-hydroxy-tetrahydrodipicolinate reductase